MNTLVILEIIFSGIFAVVLIDRLYTLVLSIRRRAKAHVAATLTEYPKVAVQLPMYNEWAVYERVIECACQLDWPKDRLIIQVLDDSTDEDIKPKINALVAAKAAEGYRITVTRRPDRRGFKAGSLQRAMSLLGGIPYVVIFDADFEPGPDFLRRTVPLLEGDASIAFVQARWTFSNENVSSLTKLQKVALDFHHRAEQQGRSNAQTFLNFNGSAGLWRVSTILDSGGWSGETLVEDMDLSLRAFIRGQVGIYLSDLECLNELPETDRTYRTQQRRWLAGPMHLATLQFKAIWGSGTLSLRHKIAASWFFLRYAYSAFNIAYLLIVLPLLIAYGSTFAVSLTLLSIGAVIPFLMNLRYWYMVVPFALGWDYSYFKLRSAIEGILRTEGSRAWTVTERAATTRVSKTGGLNREEALIGAGAALLAAGGLVYGNWMLTAYAAAIAVIYLSLAAGTPSKI